MNIKQKIITHHKTLGFDIDSAGYVKSTEENLLSPYSNWDLIKKEIENGDGNELSLKKGRINFNAVHSSCALCVNNFALVKKYKNKISLFGASDFEVAVFEKKLSTGISTPNLDFYLANNSHVIGVESKFSELLNPKFPNENLEKYLKKDLKLPNGFKEVLDSYINCGQKLYLNAAQLLKHIMGLFLIPPSNTKKRLSLVYLYWVPANWKEIELYQTHEKEIEQFKEKISGFSIKFEAFSYVEFWKLLEKNLIMQKHVKNLRERYYFEV